MTFTSWWLFACATALICVTPGPNMLYVMLASARFGLPRAAVAMAGCLTAVLFAVTASSLGLGALLTASPPLFRALRWIGAAYLLWLGWRSWRASSRSDAAAAPSEAAPRAHAIYRGALLTGLSNPKLIVFSAAFFPQFIRADRPWAPQFAILVATFATIECACYVAYALGGRRLVGWLAVASRRRLLDRTTACVFFGFGAALVARHA